MGFPLKRSLPWLAVALAAVACYAPTLSYGLVYDDKQVWMSPLLGRPFDFLALLRNEYYPENLRYGALYRPLYQWCLLLNWRANELLFGVGGSGFGFHVVNVLLHAGASVLAFAWLRALNLARFVPFLAALLFAVHPIHSEAVANVAARSEPMALCFGLGFLLAHRRGVAWAAALLLLCAMWSKETAAALAGVGLLADALFPLPAKPFPLRRWSLYTGVVAVWLALRAFALRGTHPETVFIDNPTVLASTFERVLTAAAVQVDYLRLLVWPLRQSVDYSYAHTEVVRSASDVRVLLFAAVFAFAVTAAITLRRRAPAVTLAVASYALLFAPTSNFLFPIGTIEAERLAYMPSLFFCVLAAVVITRLAGPHAATLPDVGGSALRDSPAPPRSVVAGISAGLIVALGVLTLRQNRVWKDESTLFRSAVATAPRSAKAHLHLAQTLEREGDHDAAIAHLEESTRIAPNYVYTWVALGNLRRRAGNVEGAAAAWRTGLDVDPRFTDARADLALALLDLGRRGEAAKEAFEVFARDLNHPRLTEIQDRLAADAGSEALAAARASLSRARAALDAGDAKTAVALAQELAAGATFARTERAESLHVLAAAWDRLGQPARANAYRQAAVRLVGPSAAVDPIRR